MVTNIRKDIGDITRKIISVLNKSQRRGSIVAFVSMILASFFELFGVSAIIPFISAVMNIETITDSKYGKIVIGYFGVDSPQGLLVFAGLMLIGVYVLKNVLLLLSRYVQNKYVLTIQEQLSDCMLRTYFCKSYEFFLYTDTATVVRGVEGDVVSFCEEIKQCFTLLAEMLTVFLIVLFIFITDGITALSLAVLAGVSLLLITYVFKGIMQRVGVRQRDCVIRKEKTIYEAVQGVKDIFVMQRKDFFIKRYENAQEIYCKESLVAQTVGQIPERVIETLLVGGIIIVVCVRIAMGNQADSFIPQLAALAVACFRLLPSLNKMSSAFNQMIFHEPGLNAVYENMHEINSGNKENVLETCTDAKRGSLQFEHEIVIKDILWKYQGSSKSVLENLDISIAKGSSIAFIGESGAGKTTLADIILGLLKPQGGSIFVDGKDIFDYPIEWSRLVGYVPQTVFMLDDTIRNNIVFGGNKDDDESVWEALKKSQLDEFVRNLPDGLDTNIGERGIRFSGGQRQRLAIARMMYYSPEIIVLDEATSALDNDTESAVMDAINALQGKKTLIIIAHRLSTIQNCDKIYEICEGKAILRKEKIL